MSSIGSTMTTRVTAPIVAGFGYAAKSAIDFNSQIRNIGPLLQANGESAGQVRREMTQMADASKKWSVQYGISTKSINTGLEELVKRGYSAKQSLGAMPSILNAAKASGDDFNSVMTVSTSTLEQFGLKSRTTAGMLKNTQRVTDSLTYTANATAAGFQDMGDAMTYVGPTAHASGISLEETAAAIGLMSNQGIEGSVAGTALRSALTRLMKPSKQNAAGFKELGINVADFKKGTLTLPEILNKIKTNTAGWTKEQRAAAEVVTDLLAEHKFNTRRVVIEEYLEGEEFSLMAFVDHKRFYPMPLAQDYKKILDGDLGPNTGGMGAVCPVANISKNIEQEAIENVLKPFVTELYDQGIKYTGILYAGLILTKKVIKIIEFNARFVDPETEVVLPRLQSDLSEIIEQILCHKKIKKLIGK